MGGGGEVEADAQPAEPRAMSFQTCKDWHGPAEQTKQNLLSPVSCLQGRLRHALMPPTPTQKATPQCLKRLTQELKSLSTTSPLPASVLASLEPKSEESLLEWQAVLLGPPAPSPYSDGRWLLSLTVPPTYPLLPPRIVFLTPCCHPNVDLKTGEICLDLLTKEGWTPTYTLLSAVEAVQGLLQWPEEGVDSPLNVDLAILMRQADRVAWESMVRFWCADKRWDRSDVLWLQENP